MATAATTPRRRRAPQPAHRSPAALVVGLLALGGLVYGGLQSVELAERQGGNGARVTGSSAPPVERIAEADAQPPATLTAGRDVLDLVGSPLLANELGRRAVGNDLRVLAVVPRRGFWVGTSEARRIYVEYGGRVGSNEARNGLPSVGDRVDLIGPVRRAPKDPSRTLRVGPETGALIAAQGGYVNASRWVSGSEPTG